MYWKADEDADDEEREREEVESLAAICMSTFRQTCPRKFPSSSPSASSFHREEISCFMIRRIGLEFW